jgi:hypothetical protein
MESEYDFILQPALLGQPDSESSHVLHIISEHFTGPKFPVRFLLPLPELVSQ